MSVFSNRASGAKEGAAAYIEAVLGLLGDADPVEVLSGTAAELRRLAEGLSAEQLARPEAPGKWSIAQIFQHLADSELVWGYRLRKVLAEDAPRLEGFDQDRWAEGLGYQHADPARALATFEVLRAANLALLEAAGPEGRDRYGVHVERGRESLAHMMRLYAGHDLAHRRQVGRVRGVVG